MGTNYKSEICNKDIYKPTTSSFLSVSLSLSLPTKQGRSLLLIVYLQNGPSARLGDNTVRNKYYAKQDLV